MSNHQDQPRKTEFQPIETDGIGADDSLEKTQYFTEDSSPTGTGSKSVTASDSSPTTTQKRQKIVGGYRLMKMLGEGGMGRVYQAVDESGRMVAIKLLSPELSRSPEALDRFKLEGVIASAISHPHCVFVHRADEDCGTPFIAMELMTGQTLKDIVSKRGPLPYTEAIPLVLQCIDGLIEAHSRGMIHRDVKPANCYLDEQGNVKIGDFGLARSLVSDSELTRTGSFLGTPLYASPEQILGEKVDEQSDIYSLAATIYFLLSGKAPFESPHATQVIAKIVSADPPAFSEAGVQVPKKLEQVVLRGLARDRSKRFANFQEFRDELVQTLVQRDRIATLPRRVLAYMIDIFFVSITIGLTVLLTLAFGDREPEFQYYINILGTLFQGLYLLFFEAYFGATIGKRLLNLRVVDPELSTRPKLSRCFIRTVVFMTVINVVEFATAAMLYWQGMSPMTAPVLFGAFSWLGLIAGCIALISVWKRNEKSQLLHEWISGTQTWVSVQRSVVNTFELPEPRWSIPTQAIEPSWDIPTRLGRFEIRGQIVTEDGSKWLSAHDSTIERAVWIHLNPATFPPPSESREKCIRRTRMRFLETGIQGNWRWDAYVAPDGAPIALWFDRKNPMPWPLTQKVLHDTTEEFKFIDSSQNATPTEMARWWLTSTGKLTLSEAPVKANNLSNTVASESKPLFSELACLALPNRLRRDSHSQEIHRARPKSSSLSVAPWRATQLLQRIKSCKVVEPNSIRKELEEVVQGPQSVTVTLRVVHAVILSMVVCFPWLILTFALMMSIIIDVLEEQNNAKSLTTLVAVLKDSDHHSEHIEQIDAAKRSNYLEPERIAIMENIADKQYERFARAHRSLGFFERGIIELMNRVRGREDFLDKPKPDFSKLEGFVNGMDSEETKEEVTKTKTSPRITIGKPSNSKAIQINEAPETMNSMIQLFDRLEAERKSPPPKRWFNRLRDMLIIPLCVFVVWGGLFRGGITHMVTGLAVVRRDGRRGTILQCAWRTLLFWLPIFTIAGAILVVDAHGTEWIWWTQQLRRFYFVLPILYLVAVIRWPQRGPHDMASGTYVVPR